MLQFVNTTPHAGVGRSNDEALLTFCNIAETVPSVASIGGRMGPHADVPPQMLDRVRQMCLALPDAYEQAAWVGTRWRVRQQTFAHILTIDGGWPPAYAAAAGSPGPLTVMTFQSAGQELDAFSNIGQPFFRPKWRPNIVGIRLAADTDWADVAELVTESYCHLAPAKLVAMVARPGEHQQGGSTSTST
jgi:hypothetical protein